MANEFIARKGLKILEVIQENQTTGFVTFIDNEGIIKKISIQDFYNETGIELSKLAAQQSADNALISEQNALTSADNALISEQNALTSEQNASNSETFALQYKNQAEGFKNESETAATTSTQQAILSAAARDDAESAKLAAENFADTSENSSIISTQQAVLSAAARDSAEGFKNQTVQTKIEAQDIVDTITNQVDFTGAVEGDLLERNSAGVYVPITKTDLSKSKKLLENSSLLEVFSKKNIYAWDTFQRQNNSTLGLSDSGHNWVNLIGNYQIESESANPSLIDIKGAFSAIILPDNNNRCKVTSIIQSRPANTDSRAGIWVGKDIDNCVIISSNRSSIFIEKIINGTITILESINYFSLLTNVTTLGFLNQQVLVEVYIYSYTAFSSQDIYLVVRLPQISNNNYSFSLSSDFLVFNNSIKYAGVFSLSTNQKNLGIKIEIPPTI